MTAPDIDYDKYLGVVTPRFKLLEKTEQDDVWAALPGQFQMVLTQLKHCNMFEWGLVCMTKAYIDMQEEAGKKWSHRAPRDEAHDWIKVAKKLLDMHNLAQTVASTVEAVASTALTVDAHGVRLDDHEVRSSASAIAVPSIGDGSRRRRPPRHRPPSTRH